MKDKIKTMQVVDSLIGIDRGSSDHIMSISDLLQRISNSNEDGFLVKNNGRIRWSEDSYGNWDEGHLVIEAMLEESDEDYEYRTNRERILKEEEIEERKLLAKLKLKYER